MKAQRFNITMNEQLLKELDKAAALEYASRSDFIRVAVVDRLRKLNKAIQTDHEAVSDIELEQAFQLLRKARLQRIGTKPNGLDKWREKTRPPLYRDGENC